MTYSRVYNLFLKASDPNTPAPTLEKIYKETRLARNTTTLIYEILKAVARNPNTPINILVELGNFFFEELCENPALELILIANIDLLEKINDLHPDFCYNPFHSENILPDFLLNYYCKHSDPRLRMKVASNQTIAIKYLEQLSKDSDPGVRIAVVENPTTPSFILNKLVGDRNSTVRQAVAYATTNLELLKQLSEDSNSSVRSIVAENSNTPSFLLKKLARDRSESVRLRVAKRGDLFWLDRLLLTFDFNWKIEEMAKKTLFKSIDPLIFTSSCLLIIFLFLFFLTRANFSLGTKIFWGLYSIFIFSSTMLFHLGLNPIKEKIYESFEDIEAYLSLDNLSKKTVNKFSLLVILGYIITTSLGILLYMPIYFFTRIVLYFRLVIASILDLDFP